MAEERHCKSQAVDPKKTETKEETTTIRIFQDRKRETDRWSQRQEKAGQSVVDELTRYY